MLTPDILRAAADQLALDPETYYRPNFSCTAIVWAVESMTGRSVWIDDVEPAWRTLVLQLRPNLPDWWDRGPEDDNWTSQYARRQLLLDAAAYLENHP